MGSGIIALRLRGYADAPSFPNYHSDQVRILGGHHGCPDVDVGPLLVEDTVDAAPHNVTSASAIDSGVSGGVVRAFEPILRFGQRDRP